MIKYRYLNIGRGLLYNIKHPYYIKISNNYNLQYMTEDNIKLGQRILDRISHLKYEKLLWSDALNFYKIRIMVKFGKFGKDDREVDCDILDFDTIKTTTLTNIDKEIERLQKEFNSL